MLKLAWKYMRYYKSQTAAIFAGILLTASLLAGISSLIFSHIPDLHLPAPLQMISFALFPA